MRGYLTSRWTAIGSKLLELAEEFPGEKYDARPAMGARTFAEQLRHVAFWNAYCRDVLAGKSPDGSANTFPEESYRGKRELVDLLRDGFAGVTSALAAGSAAEDGSDLQTVEGFIEHGCEHYGQLVVYCRLNGIVPPASRGDS